MFMQIREWLTNGWLIERGGEWANEFWIGGGAPHALGHDAWKTASCAIWTPDFFAVSSENRGLGPSPEGTAPFATSWSRKITRDELVTWLTGPSVTGSPSMGSAGALSKATWEPPSKDAFRKIFDRLQCAFREEDVKKAVPALFAMGWTATADRLEWIRHRILAGLEGTASNDLRLYGSWSPEKGFLGATPEALFLRQGLKISSMAVAGTRAATQLASFQSSRPSLSKAEAEALFVKEFFEDAKEQNEHAWVVRDIEGVLTDVVKSGSRAAGASAPSPVVKGETRVERFGALFHLLTPIEIQGAVKIDTRELVEALHPTPALGVSPRDSSLTLLRELHDLGGQSVARAGFGAPFVVKNGDAVEALVAIRQIRWTSDGSDRLEVVVGAGCGVVPESDFEREWNELAAKRRAIMKLFRVSTEKNEPVTNSLSILSRLLKFGVRRLVVCAGARNAPLVVAAEALRRAGEEASSGDKIIVESFFEERAAAFYALGLARALKSPVAVLTTSGTAVAELLPAMAEADFSGVPLVALTADRPRRLRESGAPQSIPQHDLFKNFVERAWDLEEGDDFDGLETLSRLRPIHVNVCLEEPLLAEAERDPTGLAEKARAANAALTNETLKIRGRDSSLVPVGTEPSFADHAVAFAALGGFFERRRAGGAVAIVGGLEIDERDAVAEFISKNQLPCLLEGPSGLRGDARLKDLELRGGDRDLQRWCLSGELSTVIRLGGVPTVRVWRDLDEAAVSTQTLSISRLRFSGLGRGQHIHLPHPLELAAFLKRATPGESSKAGDATSMTELEKSWLQQDRTSQKTLASAIEASPRSEPAFVRAFSKAIPEACVYVGNSLPIRWWDLAATRDHAIHVEANRGVNGIDGQLSTALGLAATGLHREVWILVGDLTALYDLAAPWALKLVPPTVKIRIAILNNSGGRIFTRVLAKAPGGPAPFENQHDLDFENWSKMWNRDGAMLGYVRVENAGDLSKLAARDEKNLVIEMVPSNDETAKFWTELGK